MFQYALGNALVRRLTQASRPTFDSPPDEFGDTPLGRRTTLLVHGRASERDDLDRAAEVMAGFAEIEWLDEAGLKALCPLLKVGGDGSAAGLADVDCIRIDQHALMQGYVRQLRSRGGRITAGTRVLGIARQCAVWRVTSETGERFEAPILVNAAGPWADEIARLAGVTPIGIAPLRRTIITFDAPAGTDLEHLPFTKTVNDELYFGTESGRLFASPMDEEPSDPCDSQPDEIGVATAAWRMEDRTHAAVGAVRAKWSGLRRSRICIPPRAFAGRSCFRPPASAERKVAVPRSSALPRGAPGRARAAVRENEGGGSCWRGREQGSDFSPELFLQLAVAHLDHGGPAMRAAVRQIARHEILHEADDLAFRVGDELAEVQVGGCGRHRGECTRNVFLFSSLLNH